MKTYRLYFEFYGKKMVTDVYAADVEHAKEYVAGKIHYFKVKELEEQPPPTPLTSTPLSYRKGGNKKGKTIMDFIFGFRKY